MRSRIDGSGSRVWLPDLTLNYQKDMSMNYRTVLVQVDQSSRSAVRTSVAAQLANAHGAHLVGAAATGISRFVFGEGAFNPGDPVFTHHLAHLRQYARDALTAFEQAAASAGAASVEARLVDDDAAGGIALSARYADLTVVGQFDPSTGVPGLMPNFVETVAMNSGRPLLVVPYAGDVSGRFQRPLVAWDGGLPASRAIAGALPLLSQAGTVDVVIFNPDTEADIHGAEPGADLALYLARHGIQVTVVARRVSGDIGEALLSTAADLGSDLIVMGAYGHTRFREVVLGGATRTVLQSMTVPVLMAH